MCEFTLCSRWRMYRCFEQLLVRMRVGVYWPHVRDGRGRVHKQSVFKRRDLCGPAECFSLFLLARLHWRVV